MPYQDISRRRLMLGAAATTVAITWPVPVRGQSAPADGLRILRVTALGDGSPPPLAYAGTVPGPLLRLKRGQDIAVRLINGLDEPTALDWHGLRRATTFAGPPRRPSVAPGDSHDVRFSCPDAGTFWYHAERPDQMRRGLYGVVVVEESEPIAVDRDLALVVADAAPAATVSVRTNERVRLRLVNGSSRVTAVRITAHRPLVMALDGQPCEPFAARDGEVFLGPGNRADLFVDMDLGSGATAAITAQTERGAATVATLSYGEAPLRPAPLPPPAPLPDNDLPARMDFAGAFKADLVLAGAEPAQRLVFSVRRGRAVMLGLSNRAAVPQVARVDGHAFRLLDRLDDGWKPFWLDTLVVPAGATHRIAFVPDRAGAFSITAADAAGTVTFAAWFEVT
jgi:FtsP/CotA-like multicopper oxidase with cupredoxin domain